MNQEMGTVANDRGVESRVSAERITAAEKELEKFGFAIPGHWHRIAKAALVAAGVADLESALREIAHCESYVDYDFSDDPEYRTAIICRTDRQALDFAIKTARVVLGDDEGDTK